MYKKREVYMRKIVFSSLNIDRTYHLERFVRPGETVAVKEYSCSCGGKGFNLAMAMAKAGESLFFAGAVGPDGQEFEEIFSEYGVDTSYLRHSPKMCGHAAIQVEDSGQNCIMIVEGANEDISMEYVDEVLGHFEKGDVLILQNEIGHVGYMIEEAHKKGMKVAFNPSPMNEKIEACDLSHVDYLFINEGEGEILSGKKGDDEILKELHRKYKDQIIVLTLGERGSVCISADGKKTDCGIWQSQVVDTTAAGDTFAGYFLAEFLGGNDVKRSLRTAAVASGIAVSRQGAAKSIPCRKEVLDAGFSKLQEFKRLDL